MATMAAKWRRALSALIRLSTSTTQSPFPFGEQPNECGFTEGDLDRTWQKIALRGSISSSSGTLRIGTATRDQEPKTCSRHLKHASCVTRNHSKSIASCRTWRVDHEQYFPSRPSCWWHSCWNFCSHRQLRADRSDCGHARHARQKHPHHRMFFRLRTVDG